MSLFDDASLVLIPDGAKDGTLYSVKPTDGTGDFTFTRGSNLAATRVDENGLIEKGRENLLLQSNQFDTTWESNQANREAVVSSGESGYDGSNDAWLVLDTTGSGLHQIQGGSLTLSGVNTASVYAKAYSNARYLGLGGFGLAGANEMPVFDLENGTIDTPSTTSIFKDATITSVGGGWYRCSMMFVYSGTSTLSITLCNSATNNGLSGFTYTGTGSNGFYIQDAQLEVGLVATDYIETGATTAQAGILEDMPRLDYSGGTCPALLLEPQRTNVVTNSEYISNYSSANTTITQNYGISPEGVKNSARVQFSGTGYIAFGVITYTNEVTSMYVKGTAGEKIRFGKGANVAQGALYTLTGDWQRIVYDVGSPSATFIISNFNGATANDFEVYGLQHEEGSYATSYIPTYGTSVTRGAEVCKATSVSSLIGQTEGVFYYEFINDDDLGVFAVSNNGTNSRFLNYPSGSNYVFFAQSNSAAVLISTNYAKSNFVDGVNKIAIKYASGIYKAFLNGAEVVSASIATNDLTLNKVNVNSANNDSISNKSSFNQVLIFPEVLSDADCIALTT